MTLTELAARWRTAADVLDLYEPNLARVCRSHADEMDACIRQLDNDALSLADASKESGLSVDRLRHKVSAGELPNAGRKGKPLIRRGDLPVKRKPRNNAFDAAGAARGYLRGTP